FTAPQRPGVARMPGESPPFQLGVWDVQAGDQVFLVETISVFMPTWSHDGTLLAVADGKEINLHDAATGNVVRPLNSSGHGGAPSNPPPAFTPDDQRIVREVRMRFGTAALKVLDTGSGTELLTLPLPPTTGPGAPFVFSAD